MPQLLKYSVGVSAPGSKFEVQRLARMQIPIRTADNVLVEHSYTCSVVVKASDLAVTSADE